MKCACVESCGAPTIDTHCGVGVRTETSEPGICMFSAVYTLATKPNTPEGIGPPGFGIVSSLHSGIDTKLPQFILECSEVLEEEVSQLQGAKLSNLIKLLFSQQTALYLHTSLRGSNKACRNRNENNKQQGCRTT